MITFFLLCLIDAVTEVHTQIHHLSQPSVRPSTLRQAQGPEHVQDLAINLLTRTGISQYLQPGILPLLRDSNHGCQDVPTSWPDLLKVIDGGRFFGFVKGPLPSRTVSIFTSVSTDQFNRTYRGESKVFSEPIFNAKKNISWE